MTSQAFRDGVSGRRFGWCELLRIDFPSLLLATTTHVRSVEHDGVTFEPDGAWGGIEGVRQVDELRPTRTTLHLSGLDERIIDQLRDEYVLWARIRVWWAVLDLETHKPQGIEPAGQYRAGQPTIRLDAGEGEVEIQAESMALQLRRQATLAASPSIQQQRFPGDRIFDDVARIPGREIRWARGVTRLGGGTPAPGMSWRPRWQDQMR